MLLFCLPTCVCVCKYFRSDTSFGLQLLMYVGPIAFASTLSGVNLNKHKTALPDLVSLEALICMFNV